MNSVTSAQLQPSTAQTNTCACTRAPLEQATAFVVARLLRLRNRARRLCVVSILGPAETNDAYFIILTLLSITDIFYAPRPTEVVR